MYIYDINFFINKFINLMFLAGYVAKQSSFLLSSKKNVVYDFGYFI